MSPLLSFFRCSSRQGRRNYRLLAARHLARQHPGAVYEQSLAALLGVIDLKRVAFAGYPALIKYASEPGDADDLDGDTAFYVVMSLATQGDQVIPAGYVQVPGYDASIRKTPRQWADSTAGAFKIIIEAALASVGQE